MPRRTASRKARPGRPRKTEHHGTHHRIRLSHVPAIGAAMDLGKTQEDYWKPLLQATTSPGNG